MYTNRDYEETKKAYNKFVGIYFAVAALLIAAVVTACILRIGWLGYAAAAVWAVLTVYLWGLKGGRLVRYLKYLKEMSTGRQHEVYGRVVNIEDDICIRDGVEFYTVELLMDDSKARDSEEVARRVYYDAAKGKPPFAVGDHTHLVMYGNYIKEIKNA